MSDFENGQSAEQMQNQPNSSGQSGQQGSSLLRDKMYGIMAQNGVNITDQNRSQSPNTAEQQSQQPVVNNQQDPTVPSTPFLGTDMTLEELMQTQWFKDLPKEQQEFIRNGGNPDKFMDELERAVIEQQIQSLREINELRKLQGQNELTMEEYKNQDFLQDRNSSEDEQDEETNEFNKLMRQELDGHDESIDDEEEAQERLFREIERRIEQSIDVEVEGSTTEYDKSSAALRVEIKRNKSYEESLKNILEGNDIKIKTSKKGNIKSAILKSYTQRHDHVTTPLVNSGFHITLSGASVPELIAITNMENPDSLLQLESKKLGVIKKHLVDTSFGPITNLMDLLKVIHYKDEQTLYYNLFIATFPDENDYPFTCTNEKCRAELNIKLRGSDLVLNADDFKGPIETILYKNMDIKDVIKQTKLSKIKQIILKDYTAVGIRIPSIYDRLMTMSKIENWVKKNNRDTTNLNVVFGYLMFIEYIALPNPDTGEYIRFDSINDLIEILISMEPEVHNEIDDHINKYDDSKEIEYGIKSFICPSCKKPHKPQRQKMDDLLFTLSQVRGMRNSLMRWKNREKLKSSDAGK
jgi:hypothetical protein